jgi:hypothetical protein
VTRASTPALLALHGVRILGFADSPAVARRFGLDPDQVAELLLDYEAMGWVQRAGFAGTTGWSLSDLGRVENELMLSAELGEYGVREAVESAHKKFAETNPRLLDSITKWQVRPESWDPLAVNDHTDWRWDERVLQSLAGTASWLVRLEEDLRECLLRFSGYADRFAAALARAEQGQRRWVDEPGIDSCHAVWFELHEDLLATLGLERGG